MPTLRHPPVSPPRTEEEWKAWDEWEAEDNQQWEKEANEQFKAENRFLLLGFAIGIPILIFLIWAFS